MRLSTQWPLRGLAPWPVRSHAGSRRNALVASVALSQRRQERIEVDAFMSSYLAHRNRMDTSA